MSEPFWLTRQMVVAIHDEQLTIHGGASGLRDEGMLESALDRPKNRWSYEQAELAELAAAYAFGIARRTTCFSTVTSARRCWRCIPSSA